MSKVRKQNQRLRSEEGDISTKLLEPTAAQWWSHFNLTLSSAGSSEDQLGLTVPTPAYRLSSVLDNPFSYTSSSLLFSFLYLHCYAPTIPETYVQMPHLHRCHGQLFNSNEWVPGTYVLGFCTGFWGCGHEKKDLIEGVTFERPER
jgi:hypothetical protein